MKTLVLDGSPKESGHTAKLLGAFLGKVEGEKTLMRPYEMAFTACIDCGYCRKHPGVCSVQDEMQRVYAAVETHDAVVLATPVYFRLPTPPLLAVLSRFQAYLAPDFRVLKHGPEKRGVLLVTGGGSGGAKQTRGVLLEMLGVMNAELLGEIDSLHTDSLPAEQDEEALHGAAKLAELLNA